MCKRDSDQGACLVVEWNLFVMLLVESFYQTFTDKTISDARTTSEVLVCFSCSSRKEVDALVDKAVAAGGTTPRPAQDLGLWELLQCLALSLIHI